MICTSFFLFKNIQQILILKIRYLGKTNITYFIFKMIVIGMYFQSDL